MCTGRFVLCCPNWKHITVAVPFLQRCYCQYTLNPLPSSLVNIAVTHIQRLLVVVKDPKVLFVVGWNPSGV